MSSERDLIRMHACSFNGRDLDNLASQATANAPCFCDGEWVGEGPKGMRDALEREFTQEANLMARMARLDNEPVIVEFSGGEGNWKARGALRIRGGRDGRIHEFHIDHREPVVSALVPEPME